MSSLPPGLLKRSLGFALAAIVVGALLVVVLPGDRSENAWLIGLLTLALLVAGAIIYLILLPGLYKKKIEQKGSKDLRRFVMSDPRFRELAPGPKATAKKAAEQTEPTPAAQEQKPSAPPDDDNPFLE